MTISPWYLKLYWEQPQSLPARKKHIQSPVLSFGPESAVHSASQAGFRGTVLLADWVLAPFPPLPLPARKGCTIHLQLGNGVAATWGMDPGCLLGPLSGKPDTSAPLMLSAGQWETDPQDCGQLMAAQSRDPGPSNDPDLSYCGTPTSHPYEHPPHPPSAPQQAPGLPITA